MHKIRQLIIQIIKVVFQIDDLTLFIKKKRKIICKCIYKKKYGIEELINSMKALGMKKGSIIFIHCSMMEFYNFQGDVKDLIKRIIDEIGEDGTLLMPAYPDNLPKRITEAHLNPDKVLFDVKNTPTGAGYMAEVFRKMPDVKRSVNLIHSVCAIGKDADYFLSEHYLSETAFDKKSPYYKICKKEVLIFSLGLRNFISTPLHCTESLLYKKYKYFSLFFQGEIMYKYVENNGNIGSLSAKYCSIPRVANNRKFRKRYFGSKYIKSTQLSNLLIEMMYASDVLRIFMEQTENGITLFSQPDPKPYIRNGKFIKCSED